MRVHYNILNRLFNIQYQIFQIYLVDLFEECLVASLCPERSGLLKKYAKKRAICELPENRFVSIYKIKMVNFYMSVYG